MRNYTYGASARIETGAVYCGIMAVTRDAARDLIILASPGPEMKICFHGAHAACVVQHASCSVFVVR
jgi:hypothetical protein